MIVTKLQSYVKSHIHFLTKLITTRGKLEGDKELTENYLKSTTSYNTIDSNIFTYLDKEI